MAYLLDTNACIGALNNSSPPLVKRLNQEPPSNVVLCSVVKAELICGAYRSTRVAENLRLLHKFFTAFRSISFDDLSAAHYGEIRQRLDGEGTPIGPYDLMIAAIALAHDHIVVTANIREFKRVIGLQIENWQLP